MKSRLLLILTAILYFALPSIAQVNVKRYGAVGNGKNDDTKAIQEAMNVASRTNQTLEFPSGTYLITHLDISSSMRGVGEVTLKKYSNNKLEFYTYCKVSRQSGIVISNIKFDGNVRLRPNSVIPAGGSIPLYIIHSSDIQIRNCSFVNSPMAGLRIENSSDVRVTNSRSFFTRGNYGDGFYVANSRDIHFDKCEAYDFTRIGFVTENGSNNITFLKCTAEYGHSSSKTRNGIEYNGGFWYENSANVTTIGCRVSNVTHRGFVAVTGAKVHNKVPQNRAEFIFKDCIAEDVPEGFQTASRGNVVINTSFENCKALGAERGFVLTPNYAQDKITIDGCTVTLKRVTEKTLNMIGFMWGNKLDGKKRLPTISIKDSRVNYPSTTPYQALLNRNSNTGDVSTYEGGAVHLEIDNLKNSFNKNAVIKSRRGNPSYNFRNTTPEARFIKAK